ncbi:hypothetical protein [Rubrivivax albus]|uniref:Uncharacterized protein n=1 Tax=Rubrivivax albus TaxID=2499835 RepID=A0A3S3S6S5_9BURK|nr:hypothetical protein [Rubrivivax albus]RVT46820.1 hypothetical protein ENE75_24555 [Rubrivivax albus]
MTDMPATGPKQPSSILGLSTDELAGLSSDELTNNSVAIKMLLHYYRQLHDENSALKNDNNTLKTYVDAYERKKNNSTVGAVMLAVSNVSIGFGVNLLTSGTSWPGVASLVSGIALAVAGIAITFRR